MHEEHAEATAESAHAAGGLLVAVTLRDGGRLTSRLAGDPATARGRLAELQRQLAAEQHVLIGEDTVVRADEIRSVELVDPATQATTVAPPPREPTGVSWHPGPPARHRHSRRGALDQAQEWIGYGDRPWAETKPFFLTSEFLAALLTTLAVLLAAAVADNLDAPRAWLIAGIVVAAYVVSRGLAKSGSIDPNPNRHPNRE